MSQTPEKESDTFGALLWFTFSGTAMASAFLLPMHYWAFMNGWTHDTSSPLKLGFFFVLYFCALYHSLYRVKTIAVDLGLGRFKTAISVLLALLFLVPMALLGWWVFSQSFPF